jgi:hypothetical protein
MSSFLNSIKSDLLGRRLLPVLVVLGVAFLAAVGYAVVGGSAANGGSSTVAAVPAPSISSGGSQLAVSQAPADPNTAVSETPSGSGYQREGGAHDPFIPLPSPVVKVHTASKTSSTATGGAQSGSGSSGAAGSSPSTSTTKTSTPSPIKPAKPTQPEPVYKVAVLFGPAPKLPGETTQLTPYESLKRLSPLPSSSNPLIVFTGVGGSGKGATFALIQEAILHGNAACLPNASQCQVIDLAVGQTEELQYLQADGEAVTYELSVVSIVKHQKSVAVAQRLNARVSRAGRRVLRHHGPPVLAHLRYSLNRGVLVYTAHRR